MMARARRSRSQCSPGSSCGMAAEGELRQRLLEQGLDPAVKRLRYARRTASR